MSRKVTSPYSPIGHTNAVSGRDQVCPPSDQHDGQHIRRMHNLENSLEVG